MTALYRCDCCGSRNLTLDNSIKTLYYIQMSDPGPEIQDLLQTACRLLHLRVIFKDYYQQCTLADQDRWHIDPACRRHNKPGSDNGRECHDFCTVQVMQDLLHQPHGQIHCCPFKHTELSVPVYTGSLFAGILFAGPIWQSSKPAPYPGLYERRARSLLQDQLVMLKTFATETGQIITRHQQDPGDRKQQIYRYLQEHMNEAISVQDLAEHLGISASRCGHLIKELFQQTSPEFIRQFKLQHAAHLLSSSNDTVQDIARQCGFADNNYFARIFKQHFGCSPSAWRTQGSNTA